jgi:DNA repair protein RadC
VETHFNSGHRQRLREKFLQSGFDGFFDYEIIELLLTLTTPRKDCKKTAKAVLAHFKTLSQVLYASTDELQSLPGIGPSNVVALKLFHALSPRFSQEKMTPDTFFHAPEVVYEYLKNTIGFEKKEHFLVLCFDTKNKLISEEVSVGTLNASLVHPREVFKKAILSSASHVIVAHNHPSGDTEPSPEDIQTTQRLVEAGNIIGISVVDHLIISQNGFTSMKQSGMMR